MDEIAVEHATAEIEISIPTKVAQKTVHALPARIEESGPANVAAYFKPTPLSEEKGGVTVDGSSESKRSSMMMRIWLTHIFMCSREAAVL